MIIEIYNESTLIQSFNKVLSATLSDHLSGERALEFSVITPRSQPISTGMVAKLDGQYYSIVRVARGMTNGIPVSSVSCEHISYALNNEEYNLVTFVFEGSPYAGLAQLLAGTPFSVGMVEPVSTVEVAFTEGTLNRRNAVMRFIDACGGEIEYEGYNINIRNHRGSTTRKLLMDGENVTNVSAVLDSREVVAAYEISLFKMAELTAGDEVNITFTPLGINVDTRIIGISYNPFYRYTVRVEVGDYVPNLLASTSTQLDKIKQEFRAAGGQMSSRIEDAEGNLSELSQTVDGFDLRIQSSEDDVAELSLTQYIKNNPEWEYVTVYTDEGLSGLNAKKRDGFNRMVEDALAGKIDLIVTKSVSRFARNTVDSLVTVRKLKEKGVEVYFEKEQIFTLDSKGELLITIMSSLAQEESRSISENVTWGQRKRFSDGKVSLPYSQFLGYERGQDGIPQIVEDEAELVRRIYELFMSGKTACAIAKLLTAEGIPTPAGKVKWQVSTIESILTNEKYRGSAKLQKRFTVDFLTKTMKPNEGEIPQYWVEHSHEPIILPDEWDVVQKEFARRKALGRSYSGNGIFASRIICGDCGGFYGSKVWNSTSKYRRTILQCNAKFKGEHKCTTPHLDEEQIKTRFLVAFDTLFGSKEALLENCEQVRAMYTDCTAIDAGLAELLRELDVVAELTRKCIEENAVSVQNQDEYFSRYNGYVERYDAAKVKVEALEQERTLRLARADAFETFIRTVRDMDTIPAEFDDKLWQKTIDTVTVKSDGTLVFKFQNGIEIEG